MSSWSEKKGAKAWDGAESRTESQGLQPAASPSEFPVFLSHGIWGQCAKDRYLVTNSAISSAAGHLGSYHAV